MAEEPVYEDFKYSDSVVREILEEARDYELHPEKYKRYASFDELLADIHAEMAEEDYL
jgi:hypothetical protein